jgi:hypothetical protein
MTKENDDESSRAGALDQARHDQHADAPDQAAGGARPGRTGTTASEQIAAESGEARTLGRGTSGGDDYTAINPGGTSVEEASDHRSQAKP